MACLLVLLIIFRFFLAMITISTYCEGITVIERQQPFPGLCCIHFLDLVVLYGVVFVFCTPVDPL